MHAPYIYIACNTHACITNPLRSNQSENIVFIYKSAHIIMIKYDKACTYIHNYTYVNVMHVYMLSRYKSLAIPSHELHPLSPAHTGA